MSTEVAKQEFPSIYFEVQGQKLIIRCNCPETTNPILYGMFLYKLCQGHYQTDINRALVEFAQSTGKYQVIDLVLEQFTTLVKQNNVAVKPSEVLKGE